MDEACRAYGGEDKRTEGFAEVTRSKEATWKTTRRWKNMIKTDKEIKSESEKWIHLPHLGTEADVYHLVSSHPDLPEPS